MYRARISDERWSADGTFTGFDLAVGLTRSISPITCIIAMDIEVAFAANATKYRARCKGIFNVGAFVPLDGDVIIEAIRYPVSSL